MKEVRKVSKCVGPIRYRENLQELKSTYKMKGKCKLTDQDQINQNKINVPSAEIKGAPRVSPLTGYES